MARVKGLIKIEGTLDELTFYKSKDGNLVRSKGGVSGDRIANDPAFQRTRENGNEFGSAASAGKLLRETLRNLLSATKDPNLTGRITQLMAQVKNYDTVSARGARSVAIGISNVLAQALLKSFSFNPGAVLGSILLQPVSVDTVAGEISIAAITPANDLKWPNGATHVKFTGARAKIDFASSTSDVKVSAATVLPIDNTAGAVTLTAAAPSGAGTELYLLLVEFVQEMNGNMYPLKNGGYNSLAIVELV